MVFTSPFPQYWAVRTVAPDVSPKRKRVMIYCTCPARDAPDSAVSPTAPSMMTSAAVTPTLIRFWSAHHQCDNCPIENAPVNTQGVILFHFITKHNYSLPLKQYVHTLHGSIPMDASRSSSRWNRRVVKFWILQISSTIFA